MHLFLAPLLTLLLAPAALAAEVAVVGSHDPTLDAEGQHALTTAVVASIDLAGGHDGLGPDEVTARISGREEFIVQQVFGEAGSRLLADGRILYQQAQPEEAAAMLQAALPELNASVRYTKGVRELWEAYMLLATVQLSQGDKAAAKAALAEAVALQPTRRPDPASVPPVVMELFEAALTEAMANTGRILLASVDGQVWVDGVELPKGERKAVVPPGAHHLHVLTSDGRVGYARIEVAAGADAVSTVKPGDPQLGTPGASPAQRAQQTGALYEALGRLSKLDLLLMMGRQDDRLVLQLHAPAVGGFSEPVYVDEPDKIEAVQAGVSALLAMLTPRGLLDPATTTFVPAPIDPATNPVLGRMLLVPKASGRPPVPLTGTVGQVDPDPEPAVRGKPKWPIAVGVGAGVLVATGVTLLAVLLGDPAAGGTVVFGVSE